MNLIDILGQIYNIKNEIRDIVEVNNDLSNYPAAMNKWLVDRYNEGYVVGYRQKRLELDGANITPANKLDYTSFGDYIPDTYYTSYEYDTLVDIMSWVLNVRKLMKDEHILDTASDYFPEYPALLRAMFQEVYDNGVQDGESDATSDVYPDIEVDAPVFHYTPNTFYFDPVTQDGAIIEYKLDGGKVNRYTIPQGIKESHTITYWARIGNSKSAEQTYQMNYDAGVAPPEGVTLPEMCEINQLPDKNEVVISCPTSGATIYYTVTEQGVAVISDKVYLGSVIPVNNDNTVIEAYAQNEYGTGPKNSYRAYHYDTGGGSSTDPTRVATPVITWDKPYFSISCLTSGATIYYSFNRTDWTQYPNEPVELQSTRTVYAYAVKSGLQDSIIVSMICSFEGSSDNKVATPQITVNNNIVTITCSTSGATIWWSRDNIGFTKYESPITPSDNMYIYAYATKDGMDNSNTASHYFEYSSPYEPLYCLPVICSVVTEENKVTLTCDTSGALIHYKIMTSGTENTVSSPYTFILDGTYDIYEIYCWGTKTGYNDSEMRCYTIPYYRTVKKPSKPVINLSDDGTVTIYTVTKDATLYYKYGLNGEWQTQPVDVGGRHENQITIQPTGDCVIYAKCTLDGVDSDEAGPLQYTWLTDTYDLDPPVVTRQGDRVYMTASNTIWYTINGGDPRTGGRTWNRTIPVYITEPGTVIKAVCIESINGKTHYSEVVTNVWSPVEINDDDPVAAQGNHFWVKGASTITVNTNGYTGTTFSWSYDKMTWNNANSSATGIDSSRTVYLQGFSSGRPVWDSMNFGTADSVTIGGNIMSLIYGNNFDTATAVTQESTFREMFKGATTLIDASSVVIPVTNTLGYDFYQMFAGCTQLRAAPKLNVTKLSSNSCYEMFAGCTNLMAAPEMNITSLGGAACQRMFADCTNMIQAGTFNITEMTGTYSWDIHHCEEMFKNCTNLETCNMTIGAVKENAFTSCFENCTSLKNGVSITCGITAKNCYKNMFKGCISLKSFGNLPASAVAQSAYESMFEGCTSLTGIGQMNATSVTYTRAMARMFYGCTSLATSPVIKVANLNQNACFEEMFYGCSTLNFITALFLTDPIGNSSNWPWTKNWVTDVAPMGTFVQAETASWMRTGVNAIPVNWVVSTYNANAVGTITSIDITGSTVTIVASNDDAIYYQINSQSDNGWTLYTQPFDITTSCTMYARCKNSNGEWGEIKSEQLTLGEYPLKFANSSNLITISYNTAANYRSVTYRILDSHGNQIQGWTNYDGPFDAFAVWAENYSTGDSLEITIEAKASKSNGEPTSVYTFDTTLGIEPPRAWVDGLVAKMSTETPGAVIEYYENGEWKTWTDRVIYGVTEFTVRCKLPTNDGDMYSEEKTVELRPNQVDVTEPIVSWYDRDNNILQITADEGCTISYNLAYDGIYTGYRTYDGPFEITATCDVKAIATDQYGQESDEVEYHFVYNNAGQGGGQDIPVVFTPIIAFNDPVVTITCLTDGATIYYSYDSNTWLPYNEPIELTTTTTVYAKAEKSGMYPSNVASVYCEVDGGQVDRVATPEISFDNTTNTVTIICATSDASIYYSYDNNMWDLYVGSIILSQSEYIYAKATKVGLEDSNVTSLYCEVDGGQIEKVATPVIVWNDPIVTITCATADATIWYSYNNTTWGRYNGPITLIESQTVYANATAEGMEESETTSYYCEISGEEPTGTVDTPVINWNSPTFTITCATSGATIHYSYDKTNWITYSGGVTLNDSATVYAYASKTGMDDSGITQRYCLIGSSGYESEYLTFTVNGPSGDSNYVGIRPRIYNGATIYASVNGGGFEIWSNNTKITLHSGDYIKVYSTNYLWGADDSNRFEFSSSSYPSRNHILVSGNIMSMVSPSMGTTVPATTYGYFHDFFRHRVDSAGYSIIDDNDIISDASNLVLPATTLATNCYSCMFKGCTSLVNGPAILPALTMVSGCYGSMFAKCTSLVSSPALPATTLYESCYSNMFSGCTSLVNVPSVIPATIAPYACCECMFENCTSLTTAPELPATSMSGSYAYYGMFEGCTSLVNGPSILPSTTLRTTCYARMFYGCTSLTTAPELPAATLKSNCYSNMFAGCTSLNYIKCLATNVSSSNNSGWMPDWVNGVSSSGTFVKKTGITWPTGKNGIPGGWTVQEAAA